MNRSVTSVPALENIYDQLLEEFQHLTGVTNNKLHSWRTHHEFLSYKPQSRTKFGPSLKRIDSKYKVGSYPVRLGSKADNIYLRIRFTKINFEISKGVKNYLVLMAYEYCTELLLFFIYEHPANINYEEYIDFCILDAITRATEIIHIPIKKITITNSIKKIPSTLKSKIDKNFNSLNKNYSIDVQNEDFYSVKTIYCSKDFEIIFFITLFDKIELNQFNLIAKKNILLAERTYFNNNELKEEDLGFVIDDSSSVKKIRKIAT